MGRWVVALEDASGLSREQLGGKAAGLAQLAAADLPVPPGFVILTGACDAYHEADGELPPGLEEEVSEAVAALERAAGRRFADPGDPLLVAIRSGAPQSMPGMLDTVLNIGIGPGIAEALGRRAGDPAFGLDTERRFLALYARVVLGAPAIHFTQQVRAARDRAGLEEGNPWTVAALTEVIDAHRREIGAAGFEIPDDPRRQLSDALGAVFDSWTSRRALAYREQRELPDRPGTAVLVQAMVFGNRGETSGTGVVFSRNPASGEPDLYGEFLLDAQGEDLVAGVRSPRPIDALAEQLPEAHRELERVAADLERRLGDVQDIEFTIENGRLHLLQTRAAMRTAEAAVRIAVELAQESIIDREEAVRRVGAEQLERLLADRFDGGERVAAIGRGDLLGKGLAASPGAGVGPLAFDVEACERLADAGTPPIMIRDETSPDDVPGMLVAAGVVTARGGATSHAAVIARDIGVPCVVGCEGLELDSDDEVASFAGRLLEAEDQASIDGGSGEVFAGALSRSSGDLSDRPAAATLMSWVDELAGSKVGSDASPRQRLAAAHAVVGGAESG